MANFGLIGKDIDYSFSRKYFNKKFEKENLSYKYVNFDINHIEEIHTIFKENTELKGLNVTIPYKESVLPFLDRLSPEAEAIGAVNTIQIDSNKKLIGHNTDYYGFQQAIKPFLNPYHKAALILGTGGAAKSIKFALDQWHINNIQVSRTKQMNTIRYSELDEEILKIHKIIINTTPLGTYPNTETYPELPYSYLTEKHLLFDLTYNPSQTMFMKLGAKNKAQTTNGYRMLIAQAEKAWQIWGVK